MMQNYAVSRLCAIAIALFFRVQGLELGSSSISTTISSVDRTSIFPGGDCLEDGTECDQYSSCWNCCSWYSYIAENETYACGEGACLEDGFDCNAVDSCWQCCNGAYEDGGKTCGGECLEYGTACDIDSTCNSCCNYTYWMNDDQWECGFEPCLEDDTACIPGLTCDKCCNGAYNDNGKTCGGECMSEGTECKLGEDCHMCCGGMWNSAYWFSTGKHACGYEPCYEDGTKCIPNQNCHNCCNGAFAGDGGECGGECLADGTECSLFSTCGKCCSGSYYWDSDTDSLQCGYQPCLEDGTSCIPGVTCYNCCSGAFDDNGSTCGGTCLEEGTLCDHYTNCTLCCQGSNYSAADSSNVCISYNYGQYMDELPTDTNATVAVLTDDDTN